MNVRERKFYANFDIANESSKKESSTCGTFVRGNESYRVAYRVFTRSSKRPALARVFWIHLLEVCWTSAGSYKHPNTDCEWLYVMMCVDRPGAAVHRARSAAERGIFLGQCRRESSVALSCYWHTCTRVSSLLTGPIHCYHARQHTRIPARLS